jgi:Flp pilus assembly pilin Flp
MNLRLKQNLQRFLRDEEGQSTTEYILILAVVVMIAMKFKNQVGKLIGGRIDKLETDLNQFDQM